MAQPQIPAPAKAGIAAKLKVSAAAAAKSGGGAAASDLRSNLLGDTPQAPAGSPAARIEQQIAAHIIAIYRDDIAKSFKWPFYAAALAALLAIVPGALTGRRLGEYEGHEKLNRAERAAAADGAGDPAADGVVGPAPDGAVGPATPATSHPAAGADAASSTAAGAPADAPG